MSQSVTISLPAATGTPDSMARYVQSARQVLAMAASNFERVKVRDEAERAQGVAAALGMRGVATECSIIVADAERLIAQETPPQQGHRTDLDPPQATALPPGAASKMRQAHSGLTDSQYENLKARARADSEPLSRRRIAAAAKGSQRKDEEHVRRKNAEPDPSTLSPVAATEASLRMRIAQLQAQVMERDERIALMTESQQMADIDDRFQKQAEVISALRKQVSLWQGRYNTERTRAENLSAMLKRAEERYGTPTLPNESP